LCAFYKPNEDKHMSGNGGDNAHNNQFGGGGRGPTEGVNTGSGSSNGNAGDRGYGYWKMDPLSNTPTKYGPDGQVRIEITGGINWVKITPFTGLTARAGVAMIMSVPMSLPR
jgi:hypothetical protein